MGYIKPLLASYTTCGITEELGTGQMQYTTVTLNPTATPDNSAGRGDLDGFISRSFYEGEKYGDDTINTEGTREGIDLGIGVGGDHGMAGYENVGAEAHGYIGFDISNINSTVVSATLKVYQYGTAEGDPYSQFGDLIVEHVNFGSELETTDFDSTALATVTTHSDNSSGWISIDVAQYVQDDLDNGRSYSQYRLRFTEGFFDMTYGEQGYTLFSDSEDTFGDGNVSQLEVTYY